MKLFFILLMMTLLFSFIKEDRSSFPYTDSSFIKGSFKRVPFYWSGDGDLRLENDPNLDSMIYFLNTHPAIILELGLHTDERGSIEYNKHYSQWMANKTKRMVERQLRDTSQLKAMGYGESMPIIKYAITQEQHAQNRRMELTIMDIKTD